MATSKFDIYSFVIPTWALSALINGDTSGCNDEDIEKLEKFEARLTTLRDGRMFGHWSIPGDNDFGDFRAKNDIDGWIGAEVVDLDYHILKN